MTEQHGELTEEGGYTEALMWLQGLKGRRVQVRVDRVMVYGTIKGWAAIGRDGWKAPEDDNYLFVFEETGTYGDSGFFFRARSFKNGMLLGDGHGGTALEATWFDDDQMIVSVEPAERT